MNRTAWISIGSFAFLLVLVLITREDQVSVGVRSMDLATIDADKVSKIVVKRPADPKADAADKKDKQNKSFVLEKVSGTADEPVWTVSSLKGDKSGGEKFAVEPSHMKATLASLAELEVQGFVTGRKAKHEELEIDDAKGVVVELTVGKTLLNLVLGRSAKGGGNFIRRVGEAEVFVGKGRLASNLKKDVNGWRKRKLLSVEADDLVEITMAGAQSMTLKGTPDENQKMSWDIASPALPEGFRLDKDALGRVASSLVNLRASDFFDGPLGEVQGSVTAKSAAGGTIKVAFGVTDDKKRVQAQVEGDPQVYLVGEYAVKNVLKDLDGLRDLKLILFDAKQAKRAEFSSPEGRVSVVKTEGVWALETPAPAGFEFDPSQVEPKLSSLSRLRASAIAGPPLPAKAPVKVSVTLEDGSVKTLSFGAEVPKAEGEAGGVEHFVTSAEDKLSYKIGQWQRNRYAKALELFKKPPPPPPGAGRGGGIPGMENLPPDVRKKLEESMRQQGLPGR